MSWYLIYLTPKLTIIYLNLFLSIISKMIELPVRQQKYQWSCTLDCACAAIEALTGEYVDTDEILEYIPRIKLSHHYYVDLPPEIKKKANDRGDVKYSAFYNEEYLSKAVKNISDGKVFHWDIKDWVNVSNVLESGSIKNPMFPDTEDKFFNYVEKAMNNGFVVNPGLDRINQRGIAKEAHNSGHSVLIRDISKKDGTVEILDVNYERQGLDPFYWVPYEWLQKTSIILYTKSDWKPDMIIGSLESIYD